jgi:hypothetical protein
MSQENPSCHLSPSSPSDIDDSQPPLLAAPVVEVGADFGLGTTVGVPKVRVWSTGSEGMVTMSTLNGRRIRLSHLLFNLIGGSGGSRNSLEGIHRYSFC